MLALKDGGPPDPRDAGDGPREQLAGRLTATNTATLASGQGGKLAPALMRAAALLSAIDPAHLAALAFVAIGEAC